MKKMRTLKISTTRYQRGIGLPEIMIAAVIGLLLMGALFTIFVSTRQTFRTQIQFGQLQDAERLAMVMLTNVVQAGGYYPDPLNNTINNLLPVSGAFTQAGQYMMGAVGATPNGDSITVRYVSSSGDGLMNCLGITNTSGGNVTYINVFSVDTDQNLTCSVNGSTPTPLISGVQNFTVHYGLDTNGDGSVNRYLRANAIPVNSWNNVRSVRVTLTFANPLAGQAGQAATIAPLIQIISVRGRT